jgi:hypothetical protein
MIEANKETDARVAEAMGHVWKSGTIVGCDRIGETGEGWGLGTFSWVNPECAAYTTDPALVVPMMERIGELQGGCIDLSPPGGGRTPSWRMNVWQITRVFDGPTANLACAAALLEVWERAKGVQR